MTGKQILNHAVNLIYGDRNAAYGDALTNHERIARLWTARLHEKLAPGEEVLPEDVASLMRLAKEARLINSPGHADSLTDIAGYAGVEMDIHTLRATRADAEVERLHGLP